MAGGMGMEMIGAGIETIPAILQSVMGWVQYSDAEEILKKLLKERPDMPIPQAVNMAVEIFERASRRTTLPGQDVITGDIKASTAEAVEKAKELGVAGGPEIYGFLGKAMQGEQETLSGMMPLIAQMTRGAETDYAKSLFTKGQYEQKKWEWDEAMNWKRKYAEAQQQKTEGVQNLWGGMQTATEAWSSVFSMDSMMGGGGSSGSNPLYYNKSVGGQWDVPQGNEEWLKEYDPWIGGNFG